MSNQPNFIKRHSLSIGLILMFLYTWVFDLSNSGVLPFKMPLAIYLTGGWGFIFVSLYMTGLTLGKKAMMTLLKRFLIWRVHWKWYLVALFLFPALESTSVFLTSLLTSVSVDFSHPMIFEVVPFSTNSLFLVVPWFLFEMLTNGEEMGWRGYVLPRLQARYSALIASLVVGVIWSVWHLPKFWGAGMNSDHSFAWFTVFHIAAAVLYTWLYNNSRGSLLLVTLLHASGNTVGMFLPVSFAVPGGIMSNLLTLLYILTAIIVTIVAGPERLSRTKPKQIQE